MLETSEPKLRDVDPSLNDGFNLNGGMATERNDPERQKARARLEKKFDQGDGPIGNWPER